MKLWSDSWADGERIPRSYACGRIDGAGGVAFSDNVSPHLAWSELPDGTRSLVADLPRLRRAEPGRRRQPGRSRDRRPTCRASTSSTGCSPTCRRRRARSPRAPSATASRRAASLARQSTRAGLRGRAPGPERLHRLVRRRRRARGRLFRLRRPVSALERLARPSLCLHAVRARRRARAGRRPLQRRRAAARHRRPRARRGDALRHLFAQPTVARQRVARPRPTPTRIVAVRHGETVWNAEMRMQGQLDTALSERGRRQAARVAAALADEGIEAIFASDLKRAFDTALAVAAVVGLPIVDRDGPARAQLRHFQGHTYAEIDGRWPAEAARWRRHDPDFAPAGGETPARVQRARHRRADRIAAAARGRTIFIVTPRRRARLPVPRRRRASASTRRAPGSSATRPSIACSSPASGFTLVGWSDTTHLDGAARSTMPARATARRVPRVVS